MNSSDVKENSVTRTRSDLHSPRVGREGSAVLSLPEMGRLSHFKEIVNAVGELVKIKITFFVGMSALFGFVLASGEISFKMVVSSFGIFLVACGSAVLNHYQERESDALMHRTQRRPLPSGTIAPHAALLLLIGLVIVGAAVTFAWGNLAALVLSLLAMIWYNAIYTPLKKMTAYAVIPGSFVGSLPVMAGWAAAGGSLMDPKLLVMSSFFFVWQIPHFWLLMDIYSSDYERAGFPTMRSHLSEKKFAVSTYAWMLALVAISVLFITTGVVEGKVTGILLLVLGAWLSMGAWPVVKHFGDKRTYKSAFMKINIYVLAVTVLVLVDILFKLISPRRL